jgi:hypothetical protein
LCTQINYDLNLLVRDSLIRVKVSLPRI